MRVVALFLLVLLAAAGITVQAERKNLTDWKGARRGSGACEGGMGLGVAVLLLFYFFFLVVFFNERPQIDVKFFHVSPIGAFGTCGSQEAALYAAWCAHCRLLGMRSETICVGRPEDII